MAIARVSIPSTSANLGPGYDAMGIALNFRNTVTVEHLATGAPPQATAPMIRTAGEAFFKHARCRPFPYKWDISGPVPRSRGLGSSVIVRLGILHGLNTLAGTPLSREKLFEICSELEGHPDNAAPASFGGFTLCAPAMAIQRYPIASRLKFILFIPETEILTSAARKILPKQIPLKKAVASAAHAAAIAGAFAGKKYEMLAGGFADEFHQPHRAKLMPFLDKAIAVGTQAGALGGWLSGSGSTIAFATLNDTKKILTALAKQFSNMPHTLRAVPADNRGVLVKK